MNPEDYQKLIAQRNFANIKASNARRLWIAAINNPFTKSDEELDEHHWECNDRRTEYLKLRAEASELSRMVNAANEDQP